MNERMEHVCQHLDPFLEKMLEKANTFPNGWVDVSVQMREDTPNARCKVSIYSDFRIDTSNGVSLQNIVNALLPFAEFSIGTSTNKRETNSEIGLALKPGNSFIDASYSSTYAWMVDLRTGLLTTKAKSDPESSIKLVGRRMTKCISEKLLGDRYKEEVLLCFYLKNGKLSSIKFKRESLNSKRFSFETCLSDYLFSDRTQGQIELIGSFCNGKLLTTEKIEHRDLISASLLPKQT